MGVVSSTLEESSLREHGKLKSSFSKGYVLLVGLNIGWKMPPNSEILVAPMGINARVAERH